MEEAWIGIIGAITGVIVGWALTETTRIVSEKRRAILDLKRAAYDCLDRLEKIKNASSFHDQKQVNDELYYFGADLDRYRSCIAVSPELRKRHEDTYRSLLPILLKHELSLLDTAIEEMQSIVG